ncbi:Polynucleotide 5'-hydroxyl-kinase grc3, partial [Marasmius crinis-equi]
VVTETRGIHAFVHPSSWDSAFALCEPEQVFIVKGVKKSGKSTFARTLLNHLLRSHKRVAYLECDLGQSEFTPGGMVALNVIERPVFGPPFTHPTLPNHAHYLGTLTPRSSPSHYISAIQSLAQTYQLDIKTPYDDPDEKIPLIVNTMGWTKGLGADLTRRIEEIIVPDRVFEFEVEGRGNDGGWFPHTQRQDPSIPKHHLHILRPVESSAMETSSAYYSAADHRVISILSYFHAVFPTFPSPPPPSSSLALLLKDSFRQFTAQTWSTSLPLLAQPPYEVDVQKAIESVHLIGAGSEDVVKEEINRVLNGAIVGLISSEIGNTSTSHSYSQAGIIPYVQNAPPPDPNTSRAHGLALIRGVSSELGGDTKETRLHVLTPLPSELLSTTKVLVKGEMEMPVWGLLDIRDGAPEETVRPFLQWGKGEGVGSERRRVRRNLMRKGQA